MQQAVFEVENAAALALGALDRHEVDDFDIESFDACQLPRVVREDANFSKAERVQNLRADAVLAAVAVDLRRGGRARVERRVERGVGLEVLNELAAALAEVQVEHDAAALLRDLFERAVELPAGLV